MKSLRVLVNDDGRRLSAPELWPGIRTLRSSRFRTALAATLLLSGVVVLSGVLARQAADPAGQFAFDFAAYWEAGERLASGGSLYDPQLLQGPVAAQGQDGYRYPPPMAQLLAIAQGLDMAVAAWAWLVLQAAAIWAALWYTTGLAGSRRSLERGLWCAVAAVYFLPCFDTLWKGNVSGFQALQLALVAGGGPVAGAALASAVLLKVTPLAAVPAALIRHSPMRIWVLGAGISVTALSMLLQPEPWLAYGRLIVQLMTGDAAFANNLAPAALLATSGWSGPVVTAVRLAALAIAALSVVGSVHVARRPGGWPAAVTLAVVAMLLVPASLWYHYLVILLVPAALAWSAAGRSARLVLVAGSVSVTAALAAFPLALFGGAAVLLTSLRVLWPRGEQTASGAVGL